MRAATRVTAAIVVVMVTLPLRAALAWNDFGHMQVAAVAFQRLGSAARARASQLLKLNPRYRNWVLGARPGDRERIAFVRAATWADAIKTDPDYTSTNDEQSLPTAGQNLGYEDRLRHVYWHYVDQPLAADATPTVPAAVPNAATQIAVFRATLASAGDDGLKSYDLVWLLHLVGDLHQPLHCVARFDGNDPGGDRGGGNVKVTGNAHPDVCDDPRSCPYDPPEDLHGFWDEVSGASYDSEKVDAAVRALPVAERRDAAQLDPAAWLDEGSQAARGAVYVSPVGVGDGPFALTTAYQRSAAALARRRIALAGARLAGMLEECFAKEAAAKKAAAPATRNRAKARPKSAQKTSPAGP